MLDYGSSSCQMLDGISCVCVGVYFGYVVVGVRNVMKDTTSKPRVNVHFGNVNDQIDVGQTSRISQSTLPTWLNGRSTCTLGYWDVGMFADTGVHAHDERSVQTGVNSGKSNSINVLNIWQRFLSNDTYISTEKAQNRRAHSRCFPPLRRGYIQHWPLVHRPEFIQPSRNSPSPSKRYTVGIRRSTLPPSPPRARALLMVVVGSTLRVMACEVQRRHLDERLDLR